MFSIEMVLIIAIAKQKDMSSKTQKNMGHDLGTHNKYYFPAVLHLSIRE